LSREQRIHLLRMACATDRLEFALVNRKVVESGPLDFLAEVGLRRWLEVGNAVLGPLLPRKLKLLLTAIRVWRQTHSR
jgi:hypothetical protein